jgi:DNA topoisomerase-1
MTTLVIVESPGKIKKIQSYLGSNFIVKASFGHLMDLDKKSLSIDINDNFKPNYVITNPKVVKDLIITASKCSNVILATDEDREGEAIAWFLKRVLKLENPDRIVFNNITKESILKAIKNPTKINDNMVDAQQARRLLDRLVGYRISPLLWKIMKGQLSAGRVQSVAVKIIIDRENEINDFLSNCSSSYYKTTAVYNSGDYKLNCDLVNDSTMEKYIIESKDIDKILSKFNKNTIHKIGGVYNNEYYKIPQKPFITSTLQQEASTKLGFNSKRTMMTAQKLYEAGYITYMRTDSFSLSKDILFQCKKYIAKYYDSNLYYKYREFNAKSKNAQEAHECIRPTNIEKVKVEGMTKDCEKLYELIWNRTLATQMADAKMERYSIHIDCYNLNSSGIEKKILPKDTSFYSLLERIMFNGFLILYGKENEEPLDINDNSNITFNSLSVIQEYFKPKLRYNEAGLIKFMEKNGIGRPATYSSIISKIMEREYVKVSDVEGIEKDSLQYKINKSYKLTKESKKVKIGNEKKKIIPTQLGIDVNKFMVDNFSNIMDIEFTAKFEKLLDKIARGKVKWYNVLDEYYKEFNPTVEKLTQQLPELVKKNKNDIFIGDYNYTKIYSTIGKYGLCLKQIYIENEKEKYKFYKVKDIDQNDITLDIAIDIINKLNEFPKFIGKIGNNKVNLYKGQYGFYYKMGSRTVSCKEETDIDKLNNIDYAKTLFDTASGTLREYKVGKVKYYLKKGPYGYYLNFKKNGKNINKSLDDDIDVDNFDIKKYI